MANGNLHEDFGPTLWAVNTIFIALATVAVMARFAARRLRKLPLGADDWLICLALFWDWVLYGLFVGCRINGLGKHRAVLPPQKVAVFSELLYFFQIFYVLAPPTVKLSLLFLYRRIFEHSRFLRLVYAMIALVSVWAIIMVFLAIFNCRPISAFWTHKGSCFDFKQFAIGYAVVNIVTDFAIWLMPIPDVWKIQLPTPQKIALSLIFALGLFDCAAAMARLFLSMLVLGQYDSTWLYAPGYMWSIIEVSTGITCTCLPTMRVLLKVAFGSKMARFFGMSSRKASHQRSSNKPWTRSGTARDATKARVSSSGHREDDTSDSHDPEWEVSSQQILVTEEVNVQLQPVR
ncbi:integral membrane protein [Aspergillus sp. HF37]|nr:integral membrane protein [Aspergillus sp. HF37]